MPLGSCDVAPTMRGVRARSAIATLQATEGGLRTEDDAMPTRIGWPVAGSASDERVRRHRCAMAGEKGRDAPRTPCPPRRRRWEAGVSSLSYGAPVALGASTGGARPSPPRATQSPRRSWAPGPVVAADSARALSAGTYRTRAASAPKAGRRGRCLEATCALSHFCDRLESVPRGISPTPPRYDFPALRRGRDTSSRRNQ